MQIDHADLIVAEANITLCTYEITKLGLQSVKKHCDVKHGKLKKGLFVIKL